MDRFNFIGRVTKTANRLWLSIPKRISEYYNLTPGLLIEVECSYKTKGVCKEDECEHI